MRKISRIVIIYFFAVIVGSVALKGQSSQPGSTHFNRIDAYLQSLIDTAGIPGISVAVTRNAAIIYSKAFGVANASTKIKLSTSHLFHIASISKTFAGTAVMQLVESGRLDLNAPLTTYLPYFKMNDDRFRSITIKQMLNHTSGMPDVEDYEWEKAVADTGAAERYTRSIAGLKLISDPGKEFHYSNMAYDIMADLVHKVSGQSFEEYVRMHILQPLDMRESSFYYPDTKASLRTSPHTGKPPVVSNIYPYNRMHAPSSTLNANVLELSNWAITNLQGGTFNGRRILSLQTHNAMTTPTVEIDTARKVAVGLSWFIIYRKGQRLWEHSGGDLGYRSNLSLIPDRKLSVVLLSNTEEIRMNEVKNKVLDILIEN